MIHFQKEAHWQDLMNYSLFFLTQHYLIRQGIYSFLYSCCGIKGTVDNICSLLLASFNSQILCRKIWGEQECGMVHFGSHADCTPSNHDSCRVTISPSKLLVCSRLVQKLTDKPNAPVVCCAGPFSCMWAEKSSVLPKWAIWVNS